MHIKAEINVARFVRAMEHKRLKVMDACAVCGVSNSTLAKILRGEFPQRIDAFFRVCNGLEIPIEEALIAPTSQVAKLYSLPGRRQSPQVA